MRLVAGLLLIAALSGCAGTKFYHNGQLVLETQANIKNLSVSKDGTLTAEIIDHSTATESGGDLIEGGIGAVASGITALKVIP